MIVPDLPSPITLSEPEGEKTARDERVVATGFWPKIRATLGKVPFSEDAVAGYFCATDRRLLPRKPSKRTSTGSSGTTH